MAAQPLQLSLVELRALEGPSHLSPRPIAFACLAVEGDVSAACAANLERALERQPLPFAARPLWLPPAPRPAAGGAAPRLVSALALALQRAVGLDLEVQGVAALPEGRFVCYVETLLPDMALGALKAAVEVLQLAEGAPTEAVDQALSTALFRLREQRPTRMALLGMLRLRRSGLPWRVMERIHWTLEVGQGSALRRLRITVPDDQAHSSQQLCEDKDATREILRAAGLPVPDGFPVGSAPEALEVARRLGYPLVVKMRDGSMAKGVGVDLRNDEQLLAALEKSLTLGPRVVVERFIVGDPHRLLVIDGRFHHALRRPPAQVVGDGRSSVAELIDRLNAEPLRHTNDDMGYYAFDPAEDALSFGRLLEAQSLQPDSVPEAGRLVRLGLVPFHVFGPSVDVMDRIHPAVVAMAEAAADILDLATAGIDYITPDISEPPALRNSAINEVNMAPWLSLHQSVAPGLDLVAPLMRPRVGPSEGRIPICALSDGTAPDLPGLLGDWLRRLGRPAAFAARDGAALADGRALPRRQGLRPAVQLLADPRVAAALVRVDAVDTAESGLPFDACDVAVLGDPPAADRSSRIVEEALLGIVRHAVVVPVARARDLLSAGGRRRSFLVAEGPAEARGDATLVYSDGSGGLVVALPPGGMAESFRLPDCPAALAPWLVATLLALGVSGRDIRRLAR